MKTADRSGKKAWYLSPLLPFLGWSIWFHLALSALVIVTHREGPVNAPERIEISVVEEPAPNNSEIQPNRIADQDKLNDEIDENAKFLSSHNQKVTKQTAAQKHGEFKNIRKQGPEGENQNEQQQKLARFLPKFDVSKAVDNLNERERKFNDGDVPVPMGEKKPEQAQNQGQPARKAGSDLSQSLDYIKDLDPGLETLLSTKEFKYYTFYSRIRQQVNQHWTPKIRSKVDQIYKQGRRIASTEDMITRCLVTLDSNGKLIKIQIIGVSGVRELDEAAAEAFRSAAPFPNPPKGMVDSDGTIKLRWDFILEA